MTRNFRALVLVLSAGLAAALPNPAQAQNALGDGTGLDRNLMRGGDGRNTRVRDLQAQMNFNNAIVSGNAPFGRSISGSGRSRSPGEFSGSAGSNSIFRFERDSFASGLAGTGARGTDALRYQFALSTGTFVPQVLGDVSDVTVRRHDAPQANLPTASSLRSTSDFLASQAIRPSIAGYRRNADGAVYGATASPLLGVGWMRVDQARDSSRPIDTRSSNAPESPLIPGQPPPPSDTFNPSFPRLEAPSEADVARAGRRATGLTGMEPGAAGVPGSLQTSALLNMRVQDTRMQSRSDEHSRLMKAIDTAFDPSGPSRAGTGETAAPSATGRQLSPWETELAEIRKRLSTDTWLIDATARTSTPAGITEVKPPPATTPPADGGDPAPTPSGEAPVDPGLEYAAQSLGVDVKTMKALREAGVRFERLSDPTLADQPTFRRHMAAGEQLLAAGRFFDAEDRFLRAMSALPGDPMAQAGRLHAQLGAGLFLSAALNLRQIFSDHPEMVAARYAAALRPDEDRTAKIATSLREEMAARQSALSRDAALLLAYLGHITDNAAMVSEGLKELKARSDESDKRDRALITLLEGVWTAPAAK